MDHNFLLRKLSTLPVVLEGCIMDFVFVNKHLIFPQRPWLTMAITQSAAGSHRRHPFSPVGTSRFWTWRAKAVLSGWVIYYLCCLWKDLLYGLALSPFTCVFFFPSILCKALAGAVWVSHRGSEGGKQRLAALISPSDTGLFCFWPFHFPAYFFPAL